MAKLTQEDIELFNFIINDPQSTDSEKKSAQDVLSQFGDSKKPTPKKVATKKVAPKKATPKTDNKQISDLEAKKMQLLRESGKTEEECEEIIEQYRALKSEKKTQTKKETVQKEKAKKRTTKLKKEGKTIKGTTEKNIEATLDTVTEKVVKKIDKEVDKIEKTSTTKKQVKKKISSLVSKAVKSNKKLLSDTAKELAKVDKNNAKAYLMSLRKEIDSLLTKYEYGGTIPTPFGQAGLVGETGTMNEVDLFAMGGGLPQGVHQYYAQTYNPAYPTPYGYAEGGEIPMTKLKKYKSLIEKHKAFNKFYEDTGEDYDYALEIWIPKYHELVDVYSEQEKDNLIKALNKLNSTYAKGGYVYRESDDEDATEYLTKSEAMEFIDEHNEGFETNYKSIEDFNKGEQLANGVRSIEKIKMAKGGKTQGYNDKLDESLGMRDGFEPMMMQSFKDRRDESKGMEKSMGRRAYKSVGTMDKMAKGGYVYRESDDEDATEFLNKKEVMELIEEHNKSFETNYKTIEDFNKGEEKANGIRSIEKMAKGGKTQVKKYIDTSEQAKAKFKERLRIQADKQGKTYSEEQIDSMYENYRINENKYNLPYAKGGETSSKTSNIKAELSKLQSEVTDRPPTVFERDGELFVSSEEGDEFSDYYGEYYEPQYVDERLEAIASKYGGYWDWENSGTLIFVDESYAKGGKTKRSKHSYMQDRRRISSQPWEVAYQKKKNSK